MVRQRLPLLLSIALLFEVVAISGIPLFRQFQDPDFFWHLKSGEWIWEHRALPDEFLFASPPPTMPAVVQRFTMTSYWVMQILFHLTHAAGGMVGLVALRFLLYTLLLLAIVRVKDGDNLVFLGLLVPAVVIFSQYTVERPQYVSFVFFGLLLQLLQGIRSATSRAACLAHCAAVPGLMLLWANCHGGYVVGLGIMAAWLLAESIKRLHPTLSPLPPERLRLLLGTGAAGFLASLLNPNTYHVFEVALRPSGGPAFIVEYLSTPEAFRLSAAPWILVFWALLGLVVAALAFSWRRPDLTILTLVALTGYFAFTTVRFVPFFVLGALFVLGRIFSAPRLVGRSRIAIATAGLVLGFLFLGEAAKAYQGIPRSTRVSEFHFPVEAADLVQSEGLQGELFNLYSWGGYLIWRLAPREVFIYGAIGDRSLFDLHRLILAGESGDTHGLPFWKAQFRGRGIHATVTPVFDPQSGELFGLLPALIADPAWKPLLVSPTTVVFAEDTPGNREAIRRNALPRAEFYRNLLECCAAIIKVRPTYVQAHIARGDILLLIGDQAGALRTFEEALRISPRHDIARARVKQLRGR